MAHYQVCFTRIGGQGSGAGWQAINASPGLPSEALASFSRFQNGNVYPPAFDQEDAGEQVVAELQTDGAFSFLTHIKYGLKDETGRPTMFAHSFVFPINDFVRVPQEVLNIERSNFAFDAAQTAVFKEFLSKAKDVSLNDAITALGINSNTYLLLVQCIYFALDSKAKNALHIVCDCQLETIRNILVCIYSAIPYEFRKKITCATYESQNGAPKVIIFDRQIKSSNGYYFKLQNGENNVLSDIVLKRWEKYEFMKVAPLNPTGDIVGYFAALENKLSLFGSAQTTSLDLYKIAHNLSLDDMNGSIEPTAEALSKRLNEFLSVPLNHPYIDQQIEIVLGEIIENHVVLNDVLSEKLCHKLEKTQDPNLVETGHMFNSEKISRMTVEEGGKYLYNAFRNRNADAFLKIRRLLDREQKGREILNYLYTVLVAEAMPKDKEHIIAFYEETVSLFDRVKIQERQYKMCCEYFKSIITSTYDPRLLMLETNDLLSKVFRDMSDYSASVKKLVRQTFWQRLSCEDLKVDDAEYYEDVMLQGCPDCDIAIEILYVFCYFKSGDWKPFEKSLEDLFYADKGSRFSPKDRSVLIKKLQTACVQNKHIYGDTEIDVWIIIAHLEIVEKRSPVRFLIDNRIRGFVSNFEEAYPKSVLLQNEKTKTLFVGWLDRFIEDKSEGYKVAVEALHVIKDYEKRAKQEQKKQEREIRAQEDGGKKSFLGNIGGLLSKKRRDDDNNDK